jgi:hypothetical protein
MFEDGIKGVEAEEQMKVEDISEIVVRALDASQGQAATMTQTQSQ